MTYRIAYICPTFQEQRLHGYTLRALRSFKKYTPGGVAIVVDDASPGWNGLLEQSLHAAGADHVIRYDEHGGLLRSWNVGLTRAAEIGCEFTLPSNNDVVFTPGWSDQLCRGTNQYALLGPISNAPGVTSKGNLQDVRKYDPGYQLTDDPGYLAELSLRLQAHAATFVESAVNGFLLFARTAVWWEGCYDGTHVFCPCNTFNSRGQRAPDPLNCLGEDELHRRWTARGWRSAIACSSFVFHYRSCARGDRHKHGLWFRNDSLDARV